MNTAEIKNDLHKLIAETDDYDILAKIKVYFEQLKNEDVDWWDSLSNYEIKLTEKGLRELNDGKGMYHSEVKKNIDKLLSEDE